MRLRGQGGLAEAEPRALIGEVWQQLRRVNTVPRDLVSPLLRCAPEK